MVLLVGSNSMHHFIRAKISVPIVDVGLTVGRSVVLPQGKTITARQAIQFELAHFEHVATWPIIPKLCIAFDDGHQTFPLDYV